MERLAKRIKIYRISGTIVHHCALMMKLLEHQGKKPVMIKGWCVYGRDACNHYWVRDGDINYDIGYEIGCLYNPDLKSWNPVLWETKPDGISFADEAEEDLKQEHKSQYELYHENKSAFWRNSPDDVKKFKVY
jgi:hypothetical protein